MTDLTDEAVKAIAAAKPSMLFADQDEDICIDDGRANNLVFCPARDDAVFPGDWPVLNPDVVAEIVARYNVAPDLARALIASEAARKLAEERLAKALVAREKIKAAYEELLATVHGECPSLINEDSGGSQVLLDLILAADEAITTIKELNE